MRSFTSTGVTGVEGLMVNSTVSGDRANLKLDLANVARVGLLSREDSVLRNGLTLSVGVRLDLLLHAEEGGGALMGTAHLNVLKNDTTRSGRGVQLKVVLLHFMA
jgi:hypothetical protein